MTNARTADGLSEHTVIVVDASILANALADDHADGDATRDELRAADRIAAPDLVDVETVSVLRTRWLSRALTDQRFEAAVAHLRHPQLERVPTPRMMRCAFESRANVGVKDACYVALAELLDCELVTADGRLAGAPGPRCTLGLLR